MSLAGLLLELEIGPVAHGGHCVARHEGRVVFVRHSLPGERVVARVTKGKEGDRYLFADAVEILEASPHRVSPRCELARPGGCGGCDFQHVDLAHQRRLKGAVVAEQLSRLAGIERDVEVRPVPGDEDGLRWRTRVEFAVSRRGRAGLHPHRSRDVVPLEDCPIARREVVGTGVLERTWPGAKGVDVVAPSTGDAVVVELPKGLPDTPDIVEEVDGQRWSGRVRLNARGFWQVHPGAPATFVDHVLEVLDPRPGERVLDLYSGVGLFARALADAVGPEGAVLAVESDPRAVAAAREQARGRDEIEVREERVEQALEPLLRGGDVVDLVVLDPPRAGAGRQVMADVLALEPRAVVYVACDPAALARDLAGIASAGYELAELDAFDAFPMTHHVECIAVLRPTPNGDDAPRPMC